jgi:alanyl-tRNA synthetase
MATEKLYYADPTLRRFSAQVLDCQSLKNGWSVVLDRTAFYPEGGGQPADHGTLGSAAVRDVQERDGVIFHTVDKALEIGETVEGQIDDDRRRDHTQQHSGEHILSGILCALYHCDNVGFHIGAETVTLDYSIPLSWEQAMEGQRRANAYILADVPVEISFPTPEALEQLHYRSKKALEGAVRIVAFPGADCCACCGTHVARSGQAGPVKILSVEKFHQGCRMEVLFGERALAFFDRIYEQNRTVAQTLSVKNEATAAAVSRLKEELAAARHRCGELEEAMFAAIAREYAGRGSTVLVKEGLSPDGVRRLADALAKSCGDLAAVYSPTGEGRFAYALVRADGADISELVKKMNVALSGRGGGRNGFAQGSIQAAPEDIQVFWEKEGIRLA